MFTSEATTRGVRVQILARYSPERSQPSGNKWFFLYTVTIVNESAETVQLLTRHWVVTDGAGHIDEVRGPGVVGKQPTLAPGESFEYTSGWPLPAPFGVLEGTYEMVTALGERFDAKVAPVALSEPYTVHGAPAPTRTCNRVAGSAPAAAGSLPSESRLPQTARDAV